MDSEWNEDLAFAELEDEVQTRMQENADVQALLLARRAAGPRTKTLQYGDVKIQVRATMPYTLRARALGLQAEVSRAALEIGSRPAAEVLVRAQRPIYELMAALCVDDPWTDWQTWWYVDRESGDGPKIFEEMIRLIQPDEARIARFRGE